MSTAASGRTRARDLDRANTCSVLDAAYAEGQLGADEYHDRTAQATAAKTLGELERVVGDLQMPAAVRDLVAARPAPPRNLLRRDRSADGYPGHTRAGDLDRAATIELLDSARRDGQLSEEEHETLTELAAAATTLGDLAGLVDDLQRPADATPLARPPHSSRRQWYLIAVSAAIACAAAVGFTVTSGVSETDAAPVAPVAAPAPDLGAVQPVVVATPDILTAEGLTLFLRRYREKFGDLQVDELTLFDEHARISRALPGQPNRVVTYDYRGGFQQSGAVTGRKADTPAADLAELNLAALSDALAKAPGALRVPNGAVTHMAVEVNDSGAYSYYGIAKDRPFVSIYASNKFSESGHMILTPAGEVARAWPFEG
ncbi:DUF1707 domain-containing protein [Nocardia sp. NPDC057440]|uniref:DUF1707 SHOCT-like domain-containing protein n=1 Tax=Nocardia sp. NPDC057440 TaxID=3346134 RepID=UPI003671D39B